ncbi:GNAT family N-acetyltransferase [uncultured Clostridium sp.]|uniref:GNAT family N-acetyltransferase n=1 Tax=uncultured Clostridium sp. TaxID=59620 RepID=UPI0028E5A04B|nr:GNAT family N-acetyltransferase [uncultured Clostridium sp.]
MIKYLTDKTVDYNRLIALFNQVGWNDKTEEIGRLQAMVENSQIVVTAWDKEIMIGFARCTTDYVFNGQVNNVVVDVGYRGRGIGKALINNILDENKQVTFILRADIENEGFYKKIGFDDSPLSLVYKRKK